LTIPQEEVALKIKKAVTDKKLAANRRNAKLSTGPKTARGISFSKFNATRIGLSAQAVWNPTFDGVDFSVYRDLAVDFMKKFKPQGPDEELCVSQMTRASWQLRRAALAERGAVRVDAAWSTPVENNIPAVNMLTATKAEYAVLCLARRELRTTGRLSETLYKKSGSIMRLANLDHSLGISDAQEKILRGRKLEEDTVLLRYDPVEARSGRFLTERVSNETLIVEKLDHAFFASFWGTIHLKVQQIRLYREQVSMQVKDFAEYKAIPPEKRLDQILRYEKAAQKSFEWAYQMLMTLQKHRREAEAETDGNKEDRIQDLPREHEA
jgi:hypothetical protein